MYGGKCLSFIALFRDLKRNELFHAIPRVVCLTERRSVKVRAFLSDLWQHSQFEYTDLKNVQCSTEHESGGLKEISPKWPTTTPSIAIYNRKNKNL